MSNTAYDNRIYLRWDEAAKALGLDREGLRQALRHRFSPDVGISGGQWLPVVLTTRGEGFLASLFCGAPDMQPAFYWNGRDSYYGRCEGKQQLKFSDGSVLELNGQDGEDYWEANHGHGSGIGMPFTVGGQTLIVSPAAVCYACDHDGYFDAVEIAPRGWCAEGFPSEYFRVSNLEGSMFQKKPVNLFDEGQFLAEDVMRLRVELSGRPAVAGETKAESSKDGSLRRDTRRNLLRVIRVLYEKANWPEREAVGEILQLLQSHGFIGPTDDTIRKFLEEARALKPDVNPK